VAAPIDSFVDVTYLGLELGRRVKLTEIDAGSGYLEVAAPMPVGTALELRIEPDGGGDAVAVAAVVRGVHEQVGGSDRAPGMRIEPQLAGAAQAWWAARVRPVTLASAGARPTHRMTAIEADEAKAIGEQMLRATAKPAAAAAAATATAAAAAATATAAATAADPAAPADDGIVDDGKRTEVMAAVDPDLIAKLTGGGEPLIDDGKRTQVMAVPPVMDDDDSDDGDDGNGNGNGNGETSGEIELPDAPDSASASGKLPAARGKAKRKRRRR
jgi:hypothetical protein